jgi:Methyltransferase domain
MTSSSQTTVKVDLGCGRAKRDGFIGIDHLPLPGVDIVTDLNKGIPLENDSVDYLVASHSLEHLEELPLIISEIFRIMKDRSLVTIVAPYATTLLNDANPYHLKTFNEHSARFFTTCGQTSLDAADYELPAAEFWGLGASDNSNFSADLRLLKCEFFYMPAYRGLPESAKRVLRQSLTNVVDQMLLQLIVVKTPMSDEEFIEQVRRDDFAEPPALTARRTEESYAGEPNIFGDIFSIDAKMSRRIIASNKEMIRRYNELSSSIEEVSAPNKEMIRRYNELSSSIEEGTRRLQIIEARFEARFLEIAGSPGVRLSAKVAAGISWPERRLRWLIRQTLAGLTGHH